MCLLYTFNKNLMSVVCDFRHRESLDLNYYLSLAKHFFSNLFIVLLVKILL